MIAWVYEISTECQLIVPWVICCNRQSVIFKLVSNTYMCVCVSLAYPVKLLSVENTSQKPSPRKQWLSHANDRHPQKPANLYLI